MAQNITKKQEMINRILGILNGEVPGNRFGLCICWDEDPEQPDLSPGNWNVFLVDGRNVNYEEWKKYFGKLKNSNNGQKTGS